MEITPVGKSSVSGQVYAQMVDMIVHGVWPPGTKIPSENELKTMFNVSRNTVRSVINKLSILGLLETRPGEGTRVLNAGASFYLNSYIPEIVLDKNDFIDIMEFRKGIEIEAARLAARRVTPRGVESLEEILKRLEASENDIKEYSKHDIDFHVKVAEVSGNKMFGKIMDILRYILSSQLEDFMISQGNSESIYYHPRIYEAIKNHNPHDAALAMEEHLSNVISRVEQLNKS
jgi:GntR family transcriptional repressor for pyruvate dehydrogenase complex